MDHIIQACLQAIKHRDDMTVVDSDIYGFEVELPDHSTVTVNIDEYEEDEDDEGPKFKPMKNVAAIHRVEDACDVLHVCLHAVRKDKALADSVTDLTTDGGTDDCEAIFYHQGEESFLVLRAR